MGGYSSFNFGFSYESEQGHLVRQHKHECYEIVYYAACAGTTEIDGKSYGFSPGAAAVIPPGAVHSERHSQGGKLMYIGFNTEFTDLPETGVFYFAGDLIPKLMTDILNELRLQKQNYREMICAKLTELCIIMTRGGANQNSRPRDISYVKNYIDENYNTKINFALMADLCGCSYSHLRHKFKELYGAAPQNYLVNIRLKNAYELLCEGDYNCTEVCYRCGFSNCSQFSKMFKRAFGVIPKDIKRGRR